MRQMYIAVAKRDHIESLCTTTYPLNCVPKQEPINSSHICWYPKHQKYRRGLRERCEVGDYTLNSITLDDLPYIEAILKTPLANFITFAANDCRYSGIARDLIVNWIHTFFLKYKAAASKEDNLNWREKMHSNFANDYCKAACKEVGTLEKMRAWDIVNRTPGMNVLELTWAFKLTRFTSGLIEKFKAILCAGGDK